MDSNTISLIINAFTGSSVLVIYLQNRAQRRKVESEAKQGEANAASSVVESAGKLIEIMRTDMADLKTEVKMLREENFNLRSKVREMEIELKKYLPHK